MASSNSNGAGGGGLTLLLVLFIGLKLGHVIDWSWWWVFAPMWAPLLLIVLVFAVWGLTRLFRKA